MDPGKAKNIKTGIDRGIVRLSCLSKDLFGVQNKALRVPHKSARAFVEYFNVTPPFLKVTFLGEITLYWRM